MLKKRISYTDYNGEQREEDFYFNLTKAEIAEMELSTTGGLENMVRKIVEAKDTKRIAEIFKAIILKAYGVKSDDGRRFIKSEELSTEFSQTEAYSDLYISLATNADEAAAFINGIVPKIDGNSSTGVIPFPEDHKAKQ